MKKALIEEHFRSNSAALQGFGDYIYSQAAGKVGELLYGSAGKRVAQVGCGAVALYNALKFIGRDMPLPEIIRELERLRAVRLGGRFGTRALTMRRFFRLHGVEYKLYLSPNRFKEALPRCRIAIVCSFNDRILDGMHFFCVYYRGSDDTYRAINYKYSTGETVFPIEKIRRERFAAAYCL